MFHVGSAKSRISFIALALSAAASVGCVISPRQGSAPLSPIAVGGFAIAPSATIQIKAFNFVTNSYELVGTTTASSSASASAGTLCSDSPAFYYYSTSVKLSANHWDTSFPDQNARLQVTQVASDGSTQILFGTTDPDPVRCIGSNITPGCNFYDVAYNKCGFQTTEIRIRRIG